MIPPTLPELTLLGLDGAGKTTLWNRILGKDSPLDTTPSNGLNFEEWLVRGGGGCCSQKLRIKLMDLAGNARIRAYWKRYYATSDAACFVIRAAAEARLSEARHELLEVLQQRELVNKPMLVLLNATGDGRGQAGPETVLEWLGVQIGGNGDEQDVHASTTEEVRYLQQNYTPASPGPPEDAMAPRGEPSAISTVQPVSVPTISPVSLFSGSAGGFALGPLTDRSSSESQESWERLSSAALPSHHLEGVKAPPCESTSLFRTIGAVHAGGKQDPPTPETSAPHRVLQPRFIVSHYEFVDENFCTATVNKRTLGVSRCFLDREKDEALRRALRWLTRGLAAYLEDYPEARERARNSFALATPYSTLSRSEKLVWLEKVKQRNDEIEASEVAMGSQFPSPEAQRPEDQGEEVRQEREPTRLNRLDSC